MTKRTVLDFGRGCLVRVVFYGLFLMGPCILAESHTIYVKSRCECLKIEDAAVRERALDECMRKVRLMDRFGISFFGAWFVWLMAATFMKLVSLRANRTDVDAAQKSGQ